MAGIKKRVKVAVSNFKDNSYAQNARNASFLMTYKSGFKGVFWIVKQNYLPKWGKLDIFGPKINIVEVFSKSVH